MGCTTSKTDELSQPSSTSYPVPFGHVPYCPSLPGAMGPTWDFEIEWWYYGGWAFDATETKKFTILIQTIRSLVGSSILYGIGIHTTDGAENQFHTNLAGKLSGQFPAPTSTCWSTSVSSPESSMTCKLTSGILGLRDATYQVDMADSSKNIQVSLTLKDNMGMVLEGASGAYHNKISDSYEYAMPSLAIQKGSTITFAGETTKLSSGNIWLDRQSINSGTNSSPSEPRPLYIGNWLAVTMNDQTRYMITFFWPKKKQQWIVGTKLNPPVYPNGKIGLEYPALQTWDRSSPIVGVNVLAQTEFDLNILYPDDPTNSPHWQSPTSKNTYCSAWHLRIREKTYKMTVWIPGSEVKVGTSFFEGAAAIRDENDCEVGHAFVEQMGYD